MAELAGGTGQRAEGWGGGEALGVFCSVLLSANIYCAPTMGSLGPGETGRGWEVRHPSCPTPGRAERGPGRQGSGGRVLPPGPVGRGEPGLSSGKPSGPACLCPPPHPSSVPFITSSEPGSTEPGDSAVRARRPLWHRAPCQGETVKEGGRGSHRICHGPKRVRGSLLEEVSARSEDQAVQRHGAHRQDLGLALLSRVCAWVF